MTSLLENFDLPTLPSPRTINQCLQSNPWILKLGRAESSFASNFKEL